MEIRIKELLKEKNIRMADFCRATESDPATIKTALSRGSCKIATLAKYAAALHVPVWEMIYDCGVSSVGYELEEWNTPNCDNKINEMMKSRNQKDVADKMGICQSSLSMLLQRGNPGLPNIEKLATAFGIEPYELFISKEDMQREIARRKGEPVAERVVSMEQPERKPMEDSYQEDLFVQNESPASDDDMIITMGGRRYRLVPMD